MAERDEFEVLYSEYLRACNDHDLDAMVSFYAPDIVINDSPMPPADVAAQFKPLFAAFPDWRWHVRHLWSGADTIALHFQVTGTHLGEFQRIAPTGREVSVTEFTVYQVRGGKFSAVWDLTDMAAALDQITGQSI